MMKKSNFRQTIDLIKSASGHLSQHAERIKTYKDIGKFKKELGYSMSAIGNALKEFEMQNSCD